MRVLLIGFGPFPGAPRNPSALLAKALARRRRPAFGDIVRASHIFTTTTRPSIATWQNSWPRLRTSSSSKRARAMPSRFSPTRAGTARSAA